MSANLLDQHYESDEDDGDFEGDSHPRDEVDGDEHDEDEPANARSGDSKVNGNDDEEDDDEEEDEEDEEDDEEDEDEEMPRRKRARRKINQFLDEEAEVDDDEDEVDDEEEPEEGFIVEPDEPELNERPGYEGDRRHRELDRQHERQQVEDLEVLAHSIRQRHGKSRRARQDGEVVPRRLLLPSVQDPSIWGVKCRPGKEYEVMMTIVKKMEEMEHTNRPMTILSAFCREAMQGYIYVEAYKMADVMDSLGNVSGVYTNGPKLLVPIKEMPDLMNVIKSPEIQPGTWVRYKRGKYQGDLAQVEGVHENGLEVKIRLVPRLDYGQNKDREDLPPGQKRKRPAFGKNMVANRPAQRLFSVIEATKSGTKNLSNTGSNKYRYMNEDYENGYLVKFVKVSHISTDNVNPTLEEVAKFTSSMEEGSETLDLNALAMSLRSTVSTYQAGDMVEVYEGEQQGVIGKAVTVLNDIVTMDVTEGDLKGKRIDVPFKCLRKRFREGDHVRVTGGRYRDETGTVVRIMEDKVTLVTGEDQNLEEITVFSKDLREATEAGGPTASRYDLHDLVQLDMATVACVIRVDKASLKVLDQNGDARTVLHSQIADKISRRNAVATDRNGSEVRVGDTVKEVGGETRSGTVLHIYRAWVFLHNRDITENSGVFVCRSQNVATIVTKGARANTAQQSGPDLSRMNPDVQRRNGGTAAMPPPVRIGGKDKTIGQTVTVRQGPYKGLMGIIKDASDTHARVELHTKSKVITIEKQKLGFRDSITGEVKTFQEFVRPGSSRDFGNGGGRTPAWGGAPSGSRTPQGDYSGSRTPAWMASSGSRTPAWMANDGGRTPAYQAGGKTPAWGDSGSRSVYAGNRTPAWNPSSRTPYISDSERAGSAWDAGSKTPGRPSNDPWSASSADPTARTTAVYSAPTPDASGYGSRDPISAPTPGAYISAPTPSAPTPGAISAPTPGAWGAETAPTPGATGSYGGGGRAAFPSTPGAWGTGDDDDVPNYAPTTP